MKLTNILKLSAIALFSITASCGDQKDDLKGHVHAEDAHEDHSGHDHAKSEHDDHAGHDHEGDDHDHTKCGVVVGPKGGRMIEEMAELILTEGGHLVLDFKEAPTEDTNVVLLVGSEKLVLTKEGKTYTSASVANKLPAEVHVSIKNDDDIHVEKIQVEAGKCKKCNHAKLACTCHNHNHDHDHDHDDH